MSQVLANDILLKSVGTPAKDPDGKRLGVITEVTRGHKNGFIEYLILESEACFGRGTRFFAVPASIAFVNIADSGRVILSITKDDMQFAKGVAADRCPVPNFKQGGSIFELYQYQTPAE